MEQNLLRIAALRHRLLITSRALVVTVEQWLEMMTRVFVVPGAAFAEKVQEGRLWTSRNTERAVEIAEWKDLRLVDRCGDKDPMVA